MTLQELNQRYARYQKQITLPFPQLHHSFGRAYIEKESYSEAIDALQTAIHLHEGVYPDAILALSCAQFGAQQYLEALASLQEYLVLVQSPMLASRLQKLIERLAQGRRHALLIGIDMYSSPEVSDVRGAVNDVRALKDVLHNRFGFQEENIMVLLNEEATHQAIIDAFKQLLKISRDEPALFYFAGNGSTGTDDSPTIVSVDGRQSEVFDIALQELAALASSGTHLTTIIDAGWTNSFKPYADSRTIPSDLLPKPGTRDLRRGRDINISSLQIGHVSIYPGSITVSASSVHRLTEEELPEPHGGTKKMFHGLLTHALIQSLNEADPSSLTFSQLARQISDRMGYKPIVLGDEMDLPVFSYTTDLKTGFKFFTELDRDFINQVIQLLTG